MIIINKSIAIRICVRIESVNMSNLEEIMSFYVNSSAELK